MKTRHLLALSLVGLIVSSCSGTGGSYSSTYYSGYHDPWYYRGGYYYGDIYVPRYPDRNPADRPDARPVRPTHPIARPERPRAGQLPSIPTRARPPRSSFSGGFSRGGLRGGGRRR
jgi:hypothetical protein